MSTESTLANQSFAILKEAIVRGQFAPGEKLQVAKLKSFLQVGPTPIREALSRLVSTGLVEMEPNRGFFVKKITPEEVRDVYTTFGLIEKLALSQAIDVGDAAWEGRILSALHQLAAVENGPPPIEFAKWLPLNYQFHLALVSACPLPSLLKIRENLYQELDRFCFISALINEESLSMNHREHAQIAKAVIGRDKEKAISLTSKHLEKAMQDILGRLYE